jgi:hypothetical protein
VVKDILSPHPIGHPLDDGADPRRAEAFVELAPANDPFVGRQLHEMVVPPPGIAAKNFQIVDPHRNAPSSHQPRA